jgi:hypothetical protein
MIRPSFSVKIMVNVMLEISRQGGIIRVIRRLKYPSHTAPRSHTKRELSDAVSLWDGLFFPCFYRQLHIFLE